MKRTKMLATLMAALMLAASVPAVGASAAGLTCPGYGGWSSMEYDDTTGNTTWHMKDGSLIVQDANGNVIKNTQTPQNAATPAVTQPSTGWTSDTNSDLTIQPGKSYQFKFTASDPDAIKVWTGTPGVFNVTKTATETNAVYYKITAIGTPGAAAGVYVSYQSGSGTKLCVATVAGGTSSGTTSTPSQTASGWTSDTHTDLTVQPGKSYQFKLTASDPNAFNVWMGTPGVFNITKAATETNAVYYKITAIGTPGAAAGVYVSYQNGSGTKLCVATVAGGVSSGTTTGGNTSSGSTSGGTNGGNTSSGSTSTTPSAPDTTGMTEAQRLSVEAGLTLGDYSHEYEQEVFEYTNEERVKAGLEPFVWAKSRTELAQIRAKEISTHYSHDRLNGEPTFWENIGMSSGIMTVHYENNQRILTRLHGDPKDIVRAWMESDGHKANILNPNLTAMAVGCYVAENGKIYWVQCFTSNQDELIDPITVNPLLEQ